MVKKSLAMLTVVVAVILAVTLVVAFGSSDGKLLYYVQFGIFNTLKEASVLYNELASKGEHVSIYSIESQKGAQYFTVTVGPYQSRDGALKARDLYISKYRIPGITIAETGIFNGNTPIATSNSSNNTQTKLKQKKSITTQASSVGCPISVKSPFNMGTLLGTNRVYLQATIGCGTPQLLVEIDGRNILNLPEPVQIQYENMGNGWRISGYIPIKPSGKRHTIVITTMDKGGQTTHREIIFFSNP